MNHVEKLMTGVKRRLAILLVVVMTVQSLLTSANVVAVAAPSGADPKNNIFALEGRPEEAFDYIYVQLGTAVSGEGDEISATYWYRLNNEWLEEQFEEYLSKGLLDPYSYEYDPRYTQIKNDYGSYEDYLMNQTDIKIIAPSFTCRFNDGFADIEIIEEMVNANSEIFTDTGKPIGKITVQEDNGLVFNIEFSKNIFVRQNIYGNKSMEMKLLNQYDEGTKVEVQSGSGDNSLEVVIKGDGTPIATDSNYSIEKEYEQGTNVDGEYDPSAINYLIVAKATPSNLATEANASPGSAATVSNRVASLAAAEAVDSDEDGDEIPYDALDIELFNDLLKVPTRSTIVRGSLNNGSESEYEDLTGKYITDAISSNLALDAVWVSYNEGVWEEVLLDGNYGSWEEYLADHGRIFTYEIIGMGNEQVWQCDVMLYTRIADQLWRKYAQTGALDCTFPNRAVLKNDEKSGTLAVSNKVEPEIHWEDLLQKEGQIVDINSNKVRWNIEVDAHFSGGVQLYLVDHIGNVKNTHNYIWDANNEGTITIEGEDQTVTKLELNAEILQLLADELGIDDVKKIWTELGYGTKDENNSLYDTPTISTIEKLFAILEAEGILEKDKAYNSGHHYAYEYTYQDENDEEVTDAIMLISMKDYINGMSTITYDTVVTAKANDVGAYDEVELVNSLRPVWKWSGDGGPGEMPTGFINATKRWKIRTDVVNKTADNYNSVDNTVTWLFDVNQTGKKLHHVWIKDTLDPDVMAWIGEVAATPPGAIKLVSYERSPGAVPVGQDREIKYLDPTAYDAAELSGSEDDYYTVDGYTLIVHLGPVQADEYYKFQVQTKVINPQYTSGGAFTVENTATAQVMIEDSRSIEVDLNAEAVIGNKLIEKTAIESTPGSNYDYVDNTVKWRVLLNPKQFTISGATITDTLPTGTIFGKVVNILVNGKAVNWEYEQADRIQIQDQELGLDIYIKLEEQQDGNPIFHFVDGSNDPKEISHTYVIEYTTEVTEAFRKANIRSDGKVTELLNTVVLNGQIEGVPIKNAKDDATHKIQPQSLLKEGTYHKLDKYTYYYYDSDTSTTRSPREIEAVYFNWTAYINRLGEDMTDAVVSDTLARCFEMVPATFCVEAVELDKEGKVINSLGKIVEYYRPYETPPPPSTLTELKVDESGFSFKIPEEYKGVTLKITFDTILVDDASAAEMKNAVNVQGNGWSDSSTEATDKNAQDFHYSDYNYAEGMYFLRVVKRSSNHVWENLYLAGAGFTLSRMKYLGGDVNDISNSWEADGWKKERDTNVHGVLNFLFLEPNKLYRLEEKKAPVGYDKCTKVWYVAILDPADGISLEDLKGEFPEETDNESYEVILVDPSAMIDPMHFHNMIIDNEPSNEEGTNELVFKKIGQNGQILPGVIFRLRWKNLDLATVSDADGMVKFEKLDPSEEYYTLQEFITPTGYQKATNWHAEVKLGEDGKYTIRLLDSNGVEVPKDNDGTYILKNEPIVNSGFFKKVDQNGDAITAFEVTFDVERRGDGGVSDTDRTIDLSKNAGDYKTYFPQTTVSSNEKGIVKLENFHYGYYKLTEQEDTTNLAETARASVYVKVDQDGVWAAEYGSEPPNLNYKRNLNDSDRVFEVDNVVKWGLVDVNKVVGTYNDEDKENQPQLNVEGETIPVVDALFAIYKKENKDSPWFYVKTNNDGTLGRDIKNENAYVVYDEYGIPTGETKMLPVGIYYLKEISIANYVVDGKLYEFTIAAGDFENGSYVPEKTEYVVNSDYVPYFLNIPMRHPVNLIKLDADNKDMELTDAEFDVHVGGELVAWIRYDGEKYVLKKPEGVNYRSQDDRDRKYLELKENSAGKYEYALLVGDYTITETKTPTVQFENDSYPYWAGNKTATLKVDSNGARITGGALYFDATTLKNQLKRGEFTLCKDVLWLQNSNSQTGEYAYNPVGGFTFTLTGTTLSGQEITIPKTTDIQGKLTFMDIPLGTYKLEETNVPKEYKTGTGTDAEWIVKKVPDIWVKIKAEDNNSDKTIVDFYQYEECTAILADSENADKASQSNSTIGKKEDGSLRAYNALKTANVEGVKVSHFDADGTTAQLSDAEFKLVHQTLKYADGTPYTFICKTDNTGNIRFYNVPYGQYELTEVKTPDGYLTITSILFNISEEDGTLKLNENGTYTYYLKQDDHDIYNEVALANVELCKVNQNGDAISWGALNAEFVVERISETLTGYPLGKGDTKTCQIDDSGILLIDNLAPGVYKVSEDLTGLPPDQQGLVSGDVKFWIEVETEIDDNNAAELVKVSVYDANPLAPGGATLVADIGEIKQMKTADFTDPRFAAEMNKLMKNIWPYGTVNISKVRGEWNGNGKYEAVAALAGVKFVIYEADASDEQPKDPTTPYLILKTDDNGNFPKQGQDGIYTGENGTGNKALLVGNYVIKELSLGSNTKDDAYNILSEYIPFTVTADTTTWIYTDGDSEGNLKATASNDEEAKEKYFFNVPKRGTLSFDKVDADNKGKYLEDAEFELYLMDGAGKADVEIGTIGYNAEAKTYQIVKAVYPAVQNADEIPYLVKDEDEVGTYNLLAGSYIIKETNAPRGYHLMHLMDGEIGVTIEDGKNTLVTYPSLADGGSEGIVTNVIQKASLSFVKKVEASPSHPVVNGNGTTFILRGTPTNDDDEWIEKIFTAEQLAGIDGKFIIDNLPLGSYVLSEKAATPNPYQGFGEKTEVDILKIDVSVDESGSLKVSYTIVGTKESDKSPEGITVTVPTPGTADEIVITNNWKRGSITGRKVAADNTAVGLSGAEFGLYTDKDCTSLVKTVTSSTATEPKGQFEFTNIPYGTYYVKEIKAPYGYAPSTIVYQVTVDTQEASIVKGGKLDDQNNVGQPEAIIFTNGNKRGAVELTKKAVHNDELLAGSAEFTIYADEACNEAVAYLRDTDRDGTYTLNNSGSGLITAVNGVRYLQEDENGKLLLIQGTYWLKETKVPAGYQAEMNGSNQRVYKFTIANNDGDTTQLLDTYIITNHGDVKFFYNEIATGQFTLAKTIEVSQADGLTAAGAGFWFEIAGTDAATDSGKKIAESEFLRIGGKTLAEAVAAGVAKDMGDGSIHVVTGSNGTVVVSGLLIGTYTVTELDGPNYYLYTGTTPKQVVLKQSENRAEIITTFANTTVDPKQENLTFHNTLKRSDIKGLKVRTNNRGLAGAAIGLFPAGTTEFTEANLYEGITAVSDANGYFIFKNIPYGTYRIAELKAPSGYHLNTTTSYLVSVTENGAEITIGYKEEKLVTETTASEIKIVNTGITGGGDTGGGGTGGGGPTDSGYIDTSGWPPGIYSLYVLNEQGVPQGQMLTTIEGNETPLADLAKTGDASLPAALLILTMLGAIGGITALVVKRRKEEE